MRWEILSIAGDFRSSHSFWPFCSLSWRQQAFSISIATLIKDLVPSLRQHLHPHGQLRLQTSARSCAPARTRPSSQVSMHRENAAPLERRSHVLLNDLISSWDSVMATLWLESGFFLVATTLGLPDPSLILHVTNNHTSHKWIPLAARLWPS